MFAPQECSATPLRGRPPFEVSSRRKSNLHGRLQSQTDPASGLARTPSGTGACVALDPPMFDPPLRRAQHRPKSLKYGASWLSSVSQGGPHPPSPCTGAVVIGRAFI